MWDFHRFFCLQASGVYRAKSPGHHRPPVWRRRSCRTQRPAAGRAGVCGQGPPNTRTHTSAHPGPGGARQRGPAEITHPLWQSRQVQKVPRLRFLVILENYSSWGKTRIQTLFTLYYTFSAHFFTLKLHTECLWSLCFQIPAVFTIKSLMMR